MKSDAEKEFEKILLENKYEILHGISGTRTPEQVESSMAFAAYLTQVGINQKNYPLFLHILETNNKWIVNALIGEHDPSLFFSIVKPNRRLIEKAFHLLARWHPDEIYYKVLLSILGILEYCYYKPDEGYSIYPLDINDLNNIGKFLSKDKDAESRINSAILTILDKISKMGEYQGVASKNFVVRHAFDIRIAFFDNTKVLSDVIPGILLTKISRNKREVKPSSQNVISFKQKKNWNMQ